MEIHLVLQKMKMKVYTSLLLALIFFRTVKNDKNNIVDIHTLYCKSNDPAIQNVSCSMKPISRGKTLLFISVDVAEKIENIWATLEIYQKNSVWYLPFFVNSSDHICDYFAKRTTSFYTKFAINWLAKYCNLNRLCPLKGHVECKNMSFTLDEFPAIFPPGDYRTEVKFYKDKNDKLCGTITAHSTVSVKPFSLFHN